MVLLHYNIATAIIIGLLCTIIQYYKSPVIRWIAVVYIEISRNTPLMVQLFFIYYGLPKIGIQTDAAACGVAGLAFLGGSYMSEAFRHSWRMSDYKTTLDDTCGLDYEDSLVVEGGKTK